jgi:uncharacterized YigZ family protein
VEDEAKGSRFITTLAHTPTVASAQAFVAEMRAEFPDATHNCWAYVVGPPGNTRDNGAGDDGEPAGTAGRPMLGVLLGSGLGDVAAVVTRYFGGVKLGRGGLVRAYSGGVQHALRETPRGEYRDRTRVVVSCPYPALDALRRILRGLEVEVAGERFSDLAELVIAVPVDRLHELERAVADATAGAARLDPDTRDPGE